MGLKTPAPNSSASGCSSSKMATVAEVSITKCAAYFWETMFIEANDFFVASRVVIRQLGASAANRPEFVFQPRRGTLPRFPLEFFAQSRDNGLGDRLARDLRQTPS
jgi:hypothetical protein